MRKGELNKLLEDPVYALKVEMAGKDMEIDDLQDELEITKTLYDKQANENDKLKKKIKDYESAILATLLLMKGGE